MDHDPRHAPQAEQNARRNRAAAAAQRAAGPHDFDWDVAIALLHATLRRVYRRPR